MKNKNIKNKPQKGGRWLFLHSRFSKIFRGRTSLIKGIHQLNIFLQQQQQPKKIKRAGKPSPIKTIYKKFTLRLYRN